MSSFDDNDSLSFLHTIARFRAKKKQRNVVLQETAAELRIKLEKLEKEKEAVRFGISPLDWIYGARVLTPSSLTAVAHFAESMVEGYH